MNCLVCKKNLDEFTPLCADHAPACGEWLHIGDLAIIPGELKLLDAIIIKLLGKRLVRWWLGTDVWLLHTFPKGRGRLSVLRYRLNYHLTKFLVDENWITSADLEDEFVKCGGKRTILRYHIKDMMTEKLKKVRHEGVNIGYYHPKENTEFQRYVYGIDLIELLKSRLHKIENNKINFIRLDGTLDMREVYPILDAYIRPTRHDGRPRMIAECQINNIDCYWSNNWEPNVNELYDFIVDVQRWTITRNIKNDRATAEN